jgi:hypothetical protein
MSGVRSSDSLDELLSPQDLEDLLRSLDSKISLQNNVENGNNYDHAVSDRQSDDNHDPDANNNKTDPEATKSPWWFW